MSRVIKARKGAHGCVQEGSCLLPVWGDADAASQTRILVEHDKKGHEDGHIYRAWELEGNGECPLMGGLLLGQWKGSKWDCDDNYEFWITKNH